MLKDKTVVIGVSGGIAVYKTLDVVSRLRKLGVNVNVIMTKSATEFVTPLSFQSLSQNYVVCDMFEDPKTWDVEHISLAKRADVFLIAPATANVIGKIANGIADDMLTTTVMATKAKVLIAPAMNTNMYRNPILQRNITFLYKCLHTFHLINCIKYSFFRYFIKMNCRCSRNQTISTDYILSYIILVVTTISR